MSKTRSQYKAIAAGNDLHINVVTEPSIQAIAAIASAQTQHDIQNRKRKMKETVASDTLEDAFMELAHLGRDRDHTNLSDSSNDIRKMFKTARHRADVAREEVINYPWGLIFIVRGDLNQIATEHRVKIRAVAHSKLTEAEKNEYLEEIWIDADYTRECLQLAISEKQDLIAKIIADNRVLKNHMKLVKTLENEAALLLKKK